MPLCYTLSRRLRQTAGVSPLLMRLFILVSLACILAAPCAALEAGTGRIDLGAAPGTPIAGELSRWGNLASEVESPLWVRCLYLSDGASTLYLIVFDLYAITPELHQAVLDAAPSHARPGEVVVAATGTHCGPGGLTDSLRGRFLFGPYRPRLVERFAQAAATAMEEAYRIRRRAAIGLSAMPLDGWTANMFQSDGPVADTAAVLRVEDNDGLPIALAVVAPGALDFFTRQERFTLSPHVPGAFCIALETAAGSDCVAFYLAGAQGDQRIAAVENASGFDRAHKAGEFLAQRVFEHAQDVRCTAANIGIERTPVPLPKPLVHEMPRTAEVVILNVSRARLAFTGAALDAAPAAALRTSLGTAPAAVVSVAGPWIGRLASPANFPEYSALAFYPPGVTDRLAAAVTGKMDDTQTPWVQPEAESVQVNEVRGPLGNLGAATAATMPGGLRARYQETVVPLLASGNLTGRPWSAWMPAFVETRPLALYEAAFAFRPRMKGLSPHYTSCLAAMAEAENLAFDEAWLAQCLPTQEAQAEPAKVARQTAGFVIAIAGDRAGADGLLVLHGVGQGAPLRVIELSSQGTTNHIRLSAPGRAGACSAMNAAGLVVAVVPLPEAEASSQYAAPGDAIAADLVLNAATVSEAMARLPRYALPGDVAFVLAGPSGTAKDGASGEGPHDTEPVVRCVAFDGGKRTEWKPEDGLLGFPPENETVAVLRASLADERIIGRSEIAALAGIHRSDGEALLKEPTPAGLVLYTPASGGAVFSLQSLGEDGSRVIERLRIEQPLSEGARAPKVGAGEPAS